MRMGYKTDKTHWERILGRPLLGVFVWSSIPAKIRGLNFRLKVRPQLRVYSIRVKIRKKIRSKSIWPQYAKKFSWNLGVS